MPKEVDTRYTQDRELSWLKFNERVLDEARDESVPLMERLKFAAIFTSNLDEFFMIRVGSITDMALVKETHIDNKSGRTPEEQLQAIFKAVVPLYKQRDKVFDQLDLRLRSCNICRMSMAQLDGKSSTLTTPSPTCPTNGWSSPCPSRWTDGRPLACCPFPPVFPAICAWMSGDCTTSCWRTC